MNRNDAIRAAEGMETGREWKRKLTDEELRRVNGGTGEPQFKPGSDPSNPPEVEKGRSTFNDYCRKCGFYTPHIPLAGGGYACVYCNTPS